MFATIVLLIAYQEVEHDGTDTAVVSEKIKLKMDVS